MSCCNNKANGDDKVNSHSGAGSGKLTGLLTGPRRWWLFGAIGVTAGLIFGWDKLVLFGIAPILIALLPCLVMCGFGFCMMKCKEKPGSVTAGEQVSEAGDTQSVAQRSGVSSAAHSTRTF